MRYQPFRRNCYKTTQNADPLSSSFSKIKSNTCFSHLRYQHRRQNVVIQTCLLAPTLGGTRKLKPGHMEFSPVSAGKTRQHKQTNTKKKRVGQKIACAAAKIMASQSPPHDFRQHDNQQRFCPNIVENNITIAENGPLENNKLLEQKECGLPAESTCVTQCRKARAVKTEARIAPQKQKSTNIHNKVTLRAKNLLVLVAKC